MKYWNLFWIANFILAGSSFAIITIVVAIRGSVEMRDMLVNLRREGASAKGSDKTRNPLS
jgi:hypothetical protein